MKGASNNIKIFARVRPNVRSRGSDRQPDTSDNYYVRASLESSSNKQLLGFPIQRVDPMGMTNHGLDDYQFEFDGIFNMGAEQEEVFDKVAKPVVSSVLDGFNGTIFAYGQTGSGKTFTITGGAEKYADRGLIPRSIQYIFSQIKRGEGDLSTTQIAISYLELYNEQGYDLLDESRQVTKLEDMTKINIYEDNDGLMHLKNLSVNVVQSEEEALNLLFVGDTNRMIAETPSNPSSSRSHCIFIISLVTRSTESAVVKRSKLHLVDLAGSERVARTKIDGVLLKEAKYINLSLHYLEQVIIALHEKSQGKRTHVPHRNSMMTCVLRDSLGGNCKTTMIATIATEDELIDESISTCRFSQRVALISNHATINQESDPYVLIALLQREIVKLKAEISLLKGLDGRDEGPLPDYELQRVHGAVDTYLKEGDELSFEDMRMITAAFAYLKGKCFGELPGIRANQGQTALDTIRTLKMQDAPSGNEQELIVTLKQRVAHRDNEINILVGMLNSYKHRFGEIAPDGFIKSIERQESTHRRPEAPPDSISCSAPKTKMMSNDASAVALPTLSTEKARAFDIFKNGYPSGSWIDSTKSTLKQKYKEAKGLGEEATKIRQRLKHLKNQQAEEGLTDSLRTELIETSNSYKTSYGALKLLKSEIEHLHHLLEQARIRLTRDFEHWYINVYLPTAENEAIHRTTSATPTSQLQPGSLEYSPSTPNINDVLKQYDRTGTYSTDASKPKSESNVIRSEYSTCSYGNHVPVFPGENSSHSVGGSLAESIKNVRSKLEAFALPGSRPTSRPVSVNSVRPGIASNNVRDDINAFYKARDNMLRTSSRSSNY